MGLWIEHPGIMIIKTENKFGKPLPVSEQTKEQVPANFIVTWDNVNTIMHYPEREGFDFPDMFKKNNIGFMLIYPVISSEQHVWTLFEKMNTF